MSMIYLVPLLHEPIDQGDIIDGCPILQLMGFDPRNPTSPKVTHSTHWIVVLTQTCDLANQKTLRVIVAIVHNAQTLVDQRIVKAADVSGPIRNGRVFGWYFLPSDTECDLEESVVDLRQLYTIPRDVLQTLCASGLRRARIQPLYHEHLAKHFADTYSRSGLPAPYQTN